MRKFLIVLMLFLVPPVLFAQVGVVRSSEIVKVGKSEYYMHHVEAGQTLYSISKAYNVSVEEITRLNPEVADGLKTDMVIGIPVVEPGIIEGESTVEIQNTSEPQQEQPISDDIYTVNEDESLYDIAKKFGIDIADFKSINEGLDNYPPAGLVIKVPDIVNEDDYIVHKVEEQERTSSLIKRWNVSDDEFHEKNLSVGSRVFAGQIVLIPIEPVVRESHLTIVEVEEPENGEMSQNPDEIIGHETDNQLIIEDEIKPEVMNCPIDPDNALNCYHVALLVPLYLDDVNAINVTKEDLVQVEKSRSFSFLQFYEGFMMAVDSLVTTQGLRLDLTVIDVTDKVATATAAVNKLEQSDYDLIIGPFFSKSFAVVASYAREKGIVLVNPLSTRESILDGYPNVVKLQPNLCGQIDEVTNLVRNHYRDANVFIISQEKSSDTLFLNELELQLTMAINDEVVIGNDAILQYAKDESARKEMGKRVVPTITVEGQVYSTKDIENQIDSNVMINNTITRLPYDQIQTMVGKFSGVRTNLVVACGDNNVFATQVLNGMKKSVKEYPITLVAMPQWNKFEKLSTETLLQMNAIYMDAGFVDYSDASVSRFVLQFRNRYSCEALNYAFEGFDVAWYFLNALMRYGADMMDCLPSCDIPLLRSSYRFISTDADHGLENYNWRMYQFDSESIELRLVNPLQQNETIVK